MSDLSESLRLFSERMEGGGLGDQNPSKRASAGTEVLELGFRV